jgi:hypothetical protein
MQNLKTANLLTQLSAEPQFTNKEMPPNHHIPASQRVAPDSVLSPVLSEQMKTYMADRQVRRGFVTEEDKLVLVQRIEGQDELDTSVLESTTLPESQERESQDEESQETVEIEKTKDKESSAKKGK